MQRQTIKCIHPHNIYMGRLLFCSKNIGRLLQGTLSDTMTDYKLRWLQKPFVVAPPVLHHHFPPSFRPSSLPNSFGLVANQVADTAIVRRGDFLLSCALLTVTAESSGSVLSPSAESYQARKFQAETTARAQAINEKETN